MVQSDFKCPHCGKEFTTYNQHAWVYTEWVKRNKSLFCSYKCLTEYRKDKNIKPRDYLNYYK